MAKLVLTNAKVLLGATDVSPYIKTVTITYTADTPDGTTMGAGTHTRLPGGLKDWTIALDALNDYTAGTMDAILFPLVGTAVVVEIRPDNSARGVNNPAYVGTGIMDSYAPISGAIGTEAKAPFAFKAGGVLQRLTS